MADPVSVKTRQISRDKLAKFLPTLELIKAFENLSEDVSKTLPDAIDAVAGDVTDADALLAASAFVKPQTAPPPAFTSPASDILAGQIFGA